MVRSHRWAVGILVVALAALTLPAADKPDKGDKPDKPPEEKWLIDRSLAVTPKAAPSPELKYRLFPLSSERKPGDAAPIYLRFAHERSDQSKRDLLEKPPKWNELPLEKLPLAEIKEYLKGREYQLHQLELGARRKTCDWQYTLDVEDVYGILVPDAAEMRAYAPLLVLQARRAIAEGDYAAAIHTLETGFAFSQQVAQSPFLIGNLVGISCANQFADCLLELAERPDAPNLYWAVTALPRPLIDVRSGMEFEYRVVELEFPDLADLDRERTPEQWAAVLQRVRDKIKRITSEIKGIGDKPAGEKNPVGDVFDRLKELSTAKKYLTEKVGLSAAAVEAMPTAQVVVLYFAHQYRELRDERFKTAYLPYPEAKPLLGEVDARQKALPATEAVEFARLLLPAVGKAMQAPARLERKLAALRVIEALRLHAAANGGQLPDKLEQVKVVPVPSDPMTGKPFEYQRDGQTVTLTSRLADEPLETTGLRYRVTVRK
jgi:hypothetical protein